MKVDNVHVYDLIESVIASGFPMQTEYNSTGFECAVKDCIEERSFGDIESNRNYKRACKLASNAPGTGHCNFLSGVLVSANVTGTNAWWLQMERYHFVQIVSMQSKMHRLKEMAEGGEIRFNGKTTVGAIDSLCYCASDDEMLVYSCPLGLELTARITTNYLQLKTIYNQRKDHKLKEWRDFCDWIKSLPYAEEFICGNKEKTE